MKGSGCLEAFLDTVSMDRGRRGGGGGRAPSLDVGLTKPSRIFFPILSCPPTVTVIIIPERLMVHSSLYFEDFQ